MKKTEQQKRLLLIIDPQYDFINGTLQVPEAQRIMDELADYISNQDGQYLCKAITMDWHPWDHCSFDDKGGEWPRHCVQHSYGAAVYQPVLEAAQKTKGEVILLTKGTDAGREEYSILKNSPSADRLLGYILRHGIERIDVCGIAGDICVLNTLKDLDLANLTDRLSVLERYCPSLDGGKALSDYASSFFIRSRYSLGG